MRRSNARANVGWRTPLIRRSFPTGLWYPASSIPRGGVISTMPSPTSNSFMARKRRYSWLRHGSGQQVFDHFAADISQAVVTAFKAIGKFGVLDTEATKQCGMKIVHADRVLGDVVAEF